MEHRRKGTLRKTATGILNHPFSTVLFRTGRKEINSLKYGLFMLIVLITPLTETSAQTEDGAIHTPDSLTGKYIIITEIEVSGNDKTKDRIIIRELDFAWGDSLATTQGNVALFEAGQKRFNRSDSSEVIRRLNYSRENIINTQLFLMADLYLEPLEGNEYLLRIVVQERWYFWVFPVVKLDHPNFNDWLQNPDRDLINMGIFFSHNNMLGLSHQTSLVAYAGNSQMYGFGYHIPWIGKGQKIGLKLGAMYKTSAVVEYGAVDNERQMLYDKNSLKQVAFVSTLNVRPGLYNYGTLRLDATHIRVSDSLHALTAGYLPDNQTSVSTMRLYVDYYYDSRNNRAYPLKGNYLKAFVDKKGLGILSHDVDYYHYGIDFHFYQKLNRKFYVAEMFKLIKSSSKDISYHYKQNLTSGKNFIRGFDYYALRGDELYFFRNNLKYELIKPGIRKPRKEKHQDSKFRSVPYAFYLNLFSDAAFVRDEFSEEINPYNNKFLYSWGIGIDFISYYDLVLRFEYAFTNIGTKGFFFGFGMPV